jgi:hypothetical protein
MYALELRIGVITEACGVDQHDLGAEQGIITTVFLIMLPPLYNQL